MSTDQFDALVRARRAVRKFKTDPLPEGLLEKLLDTTRWAPSGYNLQPSHYVVVTDPAVKTPLQQACMFQKQITQAPATVVFCGDKRVMQNNFRQMIAHEMAAGAMTDNYRAALEKFVPLSFDAGPAGLGRVAKSAILPVRRLLKPTPEIPLQDRRYWLAKQVSLAAMVFMLAAHAAGLGTCPMEGFDESRVKKVLKLPAHISVIMVIPVGYSADEKLKRSRLPLDQFLHMNRW